MDEMSLQGGGVVGGGGGHPLDHPLDLKVDIFIISCSLLSCCSYLFFYFNFFLNLVRREVNSTEYFVGPLSVRVSVSYLSAQLSYRGAIIVLALFSASRVSTSISYFVRPVIQAKQLAR